MTDEWADEDWYRLRPGHEWYCPRCEQSLTLGEDAVECVHESECIRLVERGGYPCGLLVCAYCRHEVEQREVSA